MALITRQAKGSKLTIQEMDNNLLYLESLGLSGTNYIFVPANGTDLQNATALQAAYNTAKTMSPSTTNRITIVAAPGNYKFQSTFIMDTEFIDFVSLTGNRDVILDLNVADPVISLVDGYKMVINFPLLINSNNVYVNGIKGKEGKPSALYSIYMGSPTLFNLGINVSNNLPNITVENCQGGFGSFGGNTTYSDPILVSGTFINCESEDMSFGYEGQANGTFIDCLVTSGYGFGSTSGYFKNCQSMASGFDTFNYNISGTFINCIVESNGFSSYLANSGKYYFCIAGFANFVFNAATGLNTGYYFNCETTGPFSINSSDGTYISCKGGAQAFSGGGQARGVYTNCIGGDNSFGRFLASGTFTNCISGTYSFASAPSYSPNDIVTASGVFNNCIGGTLSFAGSTNGVLSGKLYYCRLRTGVFKTVSGAGKTRYCIDGTDATNNQG